MKYYLISVGTIALFCFSGCKKDKVQYQSPSIICCELADSITYSKNINQILTNNCLPCHQYPGAGGINLDNYSDAKAIALSGQLYHSVIHDSNYVIMPPPPQTELDSCNIIAIKNWITQGCIH